MCGIAGILNIQSNTNLTHSIQKMTDALVHRGPDSDGFSVDENKVALGHRRLSIIDLSMSANQPFKDDSGRFTLIFNGEIYNYQDIKPLISEYPFKTTSDTEVILAAYIKWGKDCLQHLNGMFAFAIWDKKDETLFIARDRLGIKNIYYYLDNQRFIFSSEVRSLLQSGFVPRQIDKNALHNFLVFQSVYAPATMIENVYQLMPGEYAFVSKKGMEKKFYWTIEAPSRPMRDFVPQQYFQHSKPKNEIPDLKTAQKNVKELLSASVARRMVSDVPLGAFLSGGIDSSAVVALMAQASERPIDTFTVGFSEKQFDESHFADIIAKKYNTNHTNIRLSPDDFLKELPHALDAMDTPSGDGLNTYIVSKATKKAGITVALSGLGSDELFAGYSYSRRFQQLNTTFSAYWNVPKGLRNPVLSLANKAFSSNGKMQKAVNMLQENAPTIDAIYPHLRGINTEGVAAKFINLDNATQELTITRLLKARQTDINQLPFLSQMTVAEMLGYTLNVLVKDTDQFSMASALEVREPFFDYTLVEYVLGVPDSLKYDKSCPKSLLVGALGTLLPSEIVHRPKMGFSFPWRHWMLHELRPFCEKYLQNLSKYTFFNHKSIETEWHTFVQSEGKKQSYVKIWQLVVLSYWLEKNEIDF
jgi:asparagine synthase (glutamine-hydrolysing)